MFSKLSSKQEKIVNCTEPRIVVKACPGSGKTFSVSARLAKLIKDNDLGKYEKIGVMSFTNIACDEIRKNLKDSFGIEENQHSNYIGTIDSFINNYIFLPFGHLEMNCNSRPEIVGTEYNKWYDFDYTIRHPYYKERINDPNFFFDKVSFDKDDELLRLLPYSSYSFGKETWENPRKKNSSEYKKVISDLIDSKYHHFKLGKANQSDANYFAYRILKKYPEICKNLVSKFPILIIDEAQDTTEIQMSIIDLLDSHGLKSIMLIGDPDQAIFEWNTASPVLFSSKWNDEKWYQLDLLENRRSSNKICQSLNKFFGNDMISVSEDKDYKEDPQVFGYEPSAKSVLKNCDLFEEKYKKLGISDNDVAIVYRGRVFGEKYFGFIDETNSTKEVPWLNGHYYLRDFVQGAILIENGYLKQGFKQIEKGYLKYKYNMPFVSQSFIREQITTKGFKNYRKEIIHFIEHLPKKTNGTIAGWVRYVNVRNGFDLKFNPEFGHKNISTFFPDESNNENNSNVNTIHSVKGKTLDAILVFLVKKDNSNYANLLLTDFDTLSVSNKEQLRIVYVACSRPRKLLWLGVPNDDVDLWNEKLQLNSKV